MSDSQNIEKRIKKAVELKASLESKLEKVNGTPKENEFKIQIETLEDLITHLKEELDE